MENIIELLEKAIEKEIYIFNDYNGDPDVPLSLSDLSTLTNCMGMQ